MPKRPLSGYMLWLQSVREQIKQENPSFSVAEVTKKAGEMWKNIKGEEKEVLAFLTVLFFSNYLLICNCIRA